jgi:outer membrane protein assembly factor BamB
MSNNWAEDVDFKYLRNHGFIRCREHIFVGSDDGLLYCLDIDGKITLENEVEGKG